ncbi:unnamed protein product [Auanema sp. JU1783]|nr:unnamed protein product [Auanema sp. JU1783]
MFNRFARVHLFFLQICINYIICYKSDISTEDCLLQRVNPDNLNYLSLKVANKDTDHPTYNLEVESQAERAGAPYGARFLTVQNGNCSAQCTHQIVAFRPRSRDVRTHRTILYALDFQGTMIAPNYQDVKMDSPIRCARQFGYCGATIGLYRHFRYTPGGLLNAYSFSSQVNIRGFTREYYPMCYLWTLPDDLKIIGNVNMPGRSPRATTSMCMSNESMPIKELQLLRVYDNNAPGTQRDHYYTITTNETNSDLVGYTEQQPLGRVAPSPSSSCDCLTKIVQMVDKQEGIFRRLDHKIVVDGAEPNRPYEQYTETGEVFYCATEMACGATLPLWKSFHYFDVDSVITTNSDPIPYAYLYPQLPLCYIWPLGDELSTTTNPTLIAPADTTPLSSTASTSGAIDQTTVMASPEATTITPPTILTTMPMISTSIPNMESTTNTPDSSDSSVTTVVPTAFTTSETISFTIDSSLPTTSLPDLGVVTTMPQNIISSSTMLPTVGGMDGVSTVIPSVGGVETSTVNPVVNGLDGLTTPVPAITVDGVTTTVPGIIVDGLTTPVPGIIVDGLTTVVPTSGGMVDTTVLPTVGGLDGLTTMTSVGGMDGISTTLPVIVVDGELSTILPPIGGTEAPSTDMPLTVTPGIFSPTAIPALLTTPSVTGVPLTTGMINSDDPMQIANLNKMLPEMSNYLINLFFGYENMGQTTPSVPNQPLAQPTQGVLSSAGSTVMNTVESTTSVMNTEATQFASTVSQTLESTTQSTVFATSTSGNGLSTIIPTDRKAMSVSSTSDEFSSTVPASLTSESIKPNETLPTPDPNLQLDPISLLNKNGTEGGEPTSVTLPSIGSKSSDGTTEASEELVNTTDEPLKDPNITNSADIFSYSIPKVL